jgi:hypothetical protein
MIGLAPKPQELLQYIFQPWMSMHAISNQIYFFNFKGIYFYSMYHNLDNYNVHAKFVEHNGEKCSHDITILTKL